MIRLALDFGKALACLICCVLLVLFVPSSAWSADGETPSSEPSPSSSPAPESDSPSPVPTSSDASSPSPAGPSSGPSEAAPSSEPTDAPTATETVTVQADPAPVAPAAMEPGAEPVVVRLDDETTALLVLTAALVALGVGARIVGSFGGR